MSKREAVSCPQGACVRLECVPPSTHLALRERAKPVGAGGH